MSINSKMTAIADEIRTLQGGTDKLGLDAMASQVEEANATIKDQADLIANLNQKLAGKSIPTDIVMQEKNVMPSASEQTIYPDAGKYGLSKVTVEGDADLIAANIKRGVEIFGVTGKYNGPESSAGVGGNVAMFINAVDYSVNGAPQTGLYHARLPVGTTVDMEYTGQGQFLHWIDIPNGKVQGEGAKACSYMLNADISFTPVVVSDALPGESAPYSAYIEFMSEYNQVMAAGTWNSADSAQQHILPTMPFKVGANGLGWTLDGETVCTAQDILNSIDGSFAYKEIRGLYETVVVPVTLTVRNNIDDSVTVLEGTRGKNILVMEELKPGYKVAWWAIDVDGKEKLGRLFNSSKNLAYIYAYASHNTTIYAHYVPEEVETPTLSCIEIPAMYGAMLDSGPCIMAACVRLISSPDTVKANGLMTAFDGDVQEETAEQTMVLGSSAVTTWKNSGNGLLGAYTVRMQMTSEDSVLWARAYCVLTDSSGAERTIYSTVRNYTYAELMAAETFPF